MWTNLYQLIISLSSGSFSDGKICKSYEFNFAKTSMHNKSQPCICQPIEMSSWIYVKYWQLQQICLHDYWRKVLCRKCKRFLPVKNKAIRFSIFETKFIYWNKCNCRHNFILVSHFLLFLACINICKWFFVQTLMIFFFIIMVGLSFLIVK